ncbi:hypothetical protein HDK64DRAFT_249955 [Phyllosticta capitalensis]
MPIWERHASETRCLARMCRGLAGLVPAPTGIAARFVENLFAWLSILLATKLLVEVERVQSPATSFVGWGVRRTATTQKQYLEAVKVMTTTNEFRLKDFATSLYPGDESVQHHVSWVAKDVPVCPRGIAVHVEGSVFACGNACKKAAEESGSVASKQVIAPAVVVVRKKEGRF